MSLDVDIKQKSEYIYSSLLSESVQFIHGDIIVENIVLIAELSIHYIDIILQRMVSHIK